MQRNFSIKCLLILIVSVLSVGPMLAQGIKGTVTSEAGEPLAFATIYIQELNTGTTTNAEGYYEVRVAPGNYSLVYQYIGFASVEHNVVVADQFVQLDVKLRDQVVMLNDVVVRAGKEDPAYTIMRKAISKSKYHLQQVDRYTCQVYMKGTGELTDTPFLLRKTLEKEGVEEGRVFISESVSEIEYIRPNTYNEKVISIRSSGDDQSANPNAYINGSFYEPEVGGGVSPLSPRAFSYYRFEYLGTYRDRGYEVSKIRVTPRSEGDDVFQGQIEIVEDYWSIYSTDLKTSKMGINFHIKQLYEPVEENVWLPVTHEFLVDGKVLGFGFEGKYLATVSNYDVKINPDLDELFEVVDEKIYKEEAKAIEKEVKAQETTEVEEMLASGKEVTRKQLRKLMREYEKQELEESDLTQVESIRKFNVDSAAYTNDSLYWAGLRPVPLSEKELEGYEHIDSLAQVEQDKRDGDTLKNNVSKDGFKLSHMITGKRYKVGEKAYFSIANLSGLYNTVDGFDIKSGVGFRKTFESKNWLRIDHDSRYTFARTAYNGDLKVRYDYGSEYLRNSIEVHGGRYIRQFNDDEPILPVVNMLSTLLLERNYMKIYERDFVDMKYSNRLHDKWWLTLAGSYSMRRQLKNNDNTKLINRDDIDYTPNAPVAVELPDTSFPDHEALVLEARMTVEPWIKFRYYNERRYRANDFSPKFTLTYRKGIEGLLNSDVDFDQIELGYHHKFKIGIRALGDVALKAGTFLNDENMYFMDYKHFMGNLTPLLTADPVGSFRMLDYYLFSTTDEYVTASFNYQMRKFLVTRIPMVRLLGVRESFFTNYLGTTASNHYTELGYGINYIFRIFRVEAVTNWIDGEYNDWAIRIGVAANLDEMF